MQTKTMMDTRKKVKSCKNRTLLHAVNIDGHRKVAESFKKVSEKVSTVFSVHQVLGRKLQRFQDGTKGGSE